MPVPSVTDPNFDIRTPAFIVVRGYVMHVMAVQYNKKQAMNVGDSVSYKRHGNFQVSYIHEGGHAAIRHITLSGKVMDILVTNGHWLNVSNGSYSQSLTFYKRLDS